MLLGCIDHHMVHISAIENLLPSKSGDKKRLLIPKVTGAVALGTVRPYNKLRLINFIWHCDVCCAQKLRIQRTKITK